MNKSNGQVILLGTAVYLDFLENTYGKDRVHFPLDTAEWKHDRNAALAKLFEDAGDDKVVMIFELNYAANGLKEKETNDLLIIAQGHNSGLVVLKDRYTKTLAAQVEGIFTDPHTVLDANTAGFREIQSAIDRLLESPGPSHPELEP